MNTIEETTLDKNHICDRIRDWQERISSLYALVRKSLEEFESIRCSETRETIMSEELMEKFGVSPVKIPILDIKKNGELIASFKPIGLWVIGANGRIDILTKNGAFLLIDISENLTPPNWKVFRPGDHRNRDSFDQLFLQKLIENG